MNSGLKRWMDEGKGIAMFCALAIQTINLTTVILEKLQ